MKKRNPLSPLVEEVRNFFRLFLSKKGSSPKKELSEEALIGLQNVANQVAAFRKAYESALRSSLLTEEELAANLKDSVKQLDEKEREGLRELYLLRKEAELVRRRLQRALAKRGGPKVRREGSRRLSQGFRKKNWKKL